GDLAADPRQAADAVAGPPPQRGAVPALRRPARGGVLRGLRDVLLPDLPDRGQAAQGPAAVAAAEVVCCPWLPRWAIWRPISRCCPTPTTRLPRRTACGSRNRCTAASTWGSSARRSLWIPTGACATCSGGLSRPSTTGYFWARWPRDSRRSRGIAAGYCRPSR